MNRIGAGGALSRRTAVAAALAAALLPLSAGAQSDRGTRVSLVQATKKTLLLFPVDVPAASVPGAPEVSALLTDVARSRLVASDTYTVIQFFRSLPTVARLVNDQELAEGDVAPPFAEDNAKAAKIARLVGYDFVFVGSLDEYSYDEGQKQATATVSGRIFDVANNRVVRSATVSDTSATGGNAKQDERTLEAARKAAERVMTQLVPNVVRVQPVPTPPERGTAQPAQATRKRPSGWLWGLLAVGLGLGIAIAAGD